MNTEVVKRLELHQQFVASHGAPERLGEFLQAEGLDFRGIPLGRARLDGAIVPSSMSGDMRNWTLTTCRTGHL